MKKPLDEEATRVAGENEEFIFRERFHSSSGITVGGVGEVGRVPLYGAASLAGTRLFVAGGDIKFARFHRSFIR